MRPNNTSNYNNNRLNYMIKDKDKKKKNINVKSIMRRI